MKKFFKYLFILTIMFILPNFVLADETDTTFDHIDINKSVSLKYTVSGNEKIYTKTLDSLADVKLYIVDKDNSNVRTPIDLSGATATDGTYRINGNFNKLYEGTDTFVKYLVEYTFNDQDIYTNLNSNTNKSITYSKEYSFNSENNKSTDGGILIDLQEINSIQNIPTMLTIKKELENNNTPPGTFTFNIKNASGTIIKTVNITIPEGSTSKEIYFESININTTYLVEEVPDSKNIYKLLSIESTKGDPTIAHDSNATTVRATSTEDVITVTAKNGSAVDHNKEATPNGDGTYQLSLDVTGQNIKDPANKANVVVILDTSGSMSESTNKQISQTYSAVAPGGIGLYGIVNGNYVSLTRHGNDNNYYYTYRSNGRDVTYYGTLYERTTTENRMIAARNAIKSIAQSLFANNTTDNPDIVKMALVTFSTTANNAVAPTTTYSTFETAVNQAYALGGTNWEDALQKAMDINFGANREATTYYIFVSDGNPTFRNTQGNYGYLPVMDNTQWHDRWGNATNDYYTYRGDKLSGYSVYGLGMDSQYNSYGQEVGNYSPTSMTHCYDNAKDEAKSVVDNGVILYTIGAYGNAARMQNLTNYAYTGNDNTAPEGTYYYAANNTNQLNQALNEILTAIERSGIGAVTISDGTTQSITTSAGVSHLLTVDKSSYEYWLTFNLSDDNKIMVNDTEVTVTQNGSNYTLSWTEGETSKSITAPAGSYEKGNTFVYKWTGANDFYNVAPPQAKLESGSVNWVLSKEKVGLLLNDVKYTVTFNVWPSQTTYDLISDLDNDIKNYDELDPEIKKYLIKNSDGSYSLRTNTTAKLTYDDSRDEVGSRDTYFVNPEPVATGVSEVSLVKEWINNLDEREANSIELYLTVDDEIYGKTGEDDEILPYVLNKDDDWTTKVFISTGLISLDRDTGTAIVREVGHEYGFREKPSDAYYWDLVVAIRRPMVINKAKTEDSEEVELETVMLIKLTDEEKAELTTADINTLNTKNYLVKGGIEYFRICYRDENGNDIPDSCNIYRRATTNESNTISAKNYRRSNLNVTKTVNGDYDPDTLFEFDLQVNDINDNQYVWFSISDGNESYIVGDTYVISGATPEIIDRTSPRITNLVIDLDKNEVRYEQDGVPRKIGYYGVDSNNNPYTGYYYANDNAHIRVKMKAGWNLRFTNLPNGSTYIFDEVLDEEKYSFVIVKINEYREGTEKEPGVNRDTYSSETNTLVNSKINEYNLSYTVTYTNEAVKADPVTASKVWEDEDNKYSSRPNSLKLNLLADGKLKDTVTINGTSSTWNYTWENLAKYNAAGGEIVYTVTETAVNEGDLDSYIPVISSNGLTITNYYNLRDITVTKAWRANAKQATVVVRLTSDRGYDDSKPLNNPNWTYTWTDLPIYYLDINGNRQSIIYSVSEISVNDITLENGIAYDYDTYIHSTIGKWILVSIASNANGFTVTNDYKKYDYSLSFKKMSFTDYNDGKTNGLAGAKFRLYKYIGEGVSLDTDDPLDGGDNWILIAEATSNADGIMLFDEIYKDGELYLKGLYEGEYRLVEIEAPKGYVLCGGQWRLFIDLNKNTDVVSLRKFDKSTSVGRTTGLTFDDDNNIVVLNEEIPEIPATGGIGIPHYDKYGLLLMLLSVAVFLFNIVNQRKQIENI